MSKPNEQDSSSLVSLFKSIGLTQAKAADAVKAPKSAHVLKEIIESHAVVAGGLDEKKASLISTLAILLAKAGAVGSDEREYVINCILHSKLKTVDQITGEVFFRLRSFHESDVLIFYIAAVKYIESCKLPIDDSDFNKKCGVGTPVRSTVESMRDLSLFF